MRVTVNIDTKSAAAVGEDAGLEASRILAKVQSACITGGHRSGPLLDSNGNTVGRYSIDIPLAPPVPERDEWGCCYDCGEPGGDCTC